MVIRYRVTGALPVHATYAFLVWTETTLPLFIFLDLYSSHRVSVGVAEQKSPRISSQTCHQHDTQIIQHLYYLIQQAYVLLREMLLVSRMNLNKNFSFLA
jgi:hypothetical protein